MQLSLVQIDHVVSVIQILRASAASVPPGMMQGLLKGHAAGLILADGFLQSVQNRAFGLVG